MKLQKVLLVLLVIIGIVMIVKGVNMGKGITPPTLTGVGFFIIAVLINQRKPS
jgi:predicted tellurium resistance membrane protein TerC